jgi:hypothetical protein
MRIATFLIVAHLLSGALFSQRYLFYLHGRIVEDQGPNAVDTIRGFGAYEYENILNSFRKEKLIVISEVRKKNTDVEEYARKVSGQIDTLLKKGTVAGYITVVGASKGAAIAMVVSTLLKNQDVNFVFIAGCNDDNFKRLPPIKFCGNILSVYERSDDIAGSCTPIKNRSSKLIPHYKEIELNTGLKHGFLYQPLTEWVQPVIQWANGNYK